MRVEPRSGRNRVRQQTPPPFGCAGAHVPGEELHGEQAQQTDQGVHAHFLRIGQVQRRNGGEQRRDTPADGPKQLFSNPVHQRDGEDPENQRQETQRELGRTRQCHPDVQRPEVERWVDVHRRDDWDFQQTVAGDEQAVPFIPPQALRGQPVQAQRSGDQYDQPGDITDAHLPRRQGARCGGACRPCRFSRRAHSSRISRMT